MSSTNNILHDEDSQDVMVIDKQLQNLEKEQHQTEDTPCTICNKAAKEKYICCGECQCRVHYRCAFLPTYQLYYFVEKTRKYTCVNCTPQALVDLRSDGVDVLIRDIRNHLEELKKMNNLIQKQNEYLREENIRIKNTLE